MRARLGCAKLVWSSLTSLGFSRGRPSKADPIFRGSKPALSAMKPPTSRTSKADPIFRGSKPVKPRTISAATSLPKQTRSSGGQNRPGPIDPHRSPAFQSRPDLQGVKTIHEPKPSTRVTSKADPIFRGSKPRDTRCRHLPPTFQSRPDLQGVKTVVRKHLLSFFCLPKQTRSSGGQNRPASSPAPISSGFQSRPDLQGVKTRHA